MLRGLRHPVEAIRTAPVQISGAALSIGVDVQGLHEAGILLNTGDWRVTAISVGALSLNTLAGGFNTVLAREKLRLRNRLESNLERYGFDDRPLGVTTSTYCTRQAARIACENYGVLDQYKQLCAERSEGTSFTWLPHI